MVDVLLEYIEKLQRNTGHHIGLSTEEVDALAATMEVRHYNKKEKLIDINQKEQYLHFVVRGLVRKFFYKGKQEIVTQLSKEGDLVSSTVSFFSELPSEYVVETIEPTTFYSLSKEKMDQLCTQYPNLNKLGRLILTDLVLQRENWELNQLKYNLKERFFQFIENNADLVSRVPQKYLAAYLNIKPETFSRLKHLLNKDTQPRSVK